MKSPKRQEYIAFLWDAFGTNYTHGKYQFAFLAYHMLTMSFVYFNIWQIRQTRPAVGHKSGNVKDLIAQRMRHSRSVAPIRGG